MMVFRSLILWFLLIVVGFDSTIGLTTHEAAHLHSEQVNLSLAENTDAGAGETSPATQKEELCASCIAYAQLSLAVFLSHFSETLYAFPTFKAAAVGEGIFASFYRKYSSARDPPSLIA